MLQLFVYLSSPTIIVTGLGFAFIVRSSKKSFAVYAGSFDEKAQWVNHLMHQSSVIVKEKCRYNSKTSLYWRYISIDVLVTNKLSVYNLCVTAPVKSNLSYTWLLFSTILINIFCLYYEINIAYKSAYLINGVISCLDPSDSTTKNCLPL